MTKKKQGLKVQRILPAEAYLHLGEERVQSAIRLPSSLKEEADRAIDFLNKPERKVNFNSFVESAVRWYLDALREEGQI